MGAITPSLTLGDCVTFMIGVMDILSGVLFAMVAVGVIYIVSRVIHDLLRPCYLILESLWGSCVDVYWYYFHPGTSLIMPVVQFLFGQFITSIDADIGNSSGAQCHILFSDHGKDLHGSPFTATMVVFQLSTFDLDPAHVSGVLTRLHCLFLAVNTYFKGITQSETLLLDLLRR